MKSRILSYALIGSLVVAATLWFYFTASTPRDSALLRASVRPDCAPWDGTAYTIDIPYPAGSAIEISIWKSPDSALPLTYSFPDASGRVGTAVYRSAFGSDQPLYGEITLRPFKLGDALEGRFRFKLESGNQFAGEFSADWLDQPVACG